MIFGLCKCWSGFVLPSANVGCLLASIVAHLVFQVLRWRGGAGFVGLPPLPQCAQFPLACQSPLPLSSLVLYSAPSAARVSFDATLCQVYVSGAGGGLLTQTYTVAARWPWWFTHHCRHCALFCTCTTPTPPWWKSALPCIEEHTFREYI